MTPQGSTVPKLYVWPDRTLYLGASYIPLRQYTVATDQLVVCLAGEISFCLKGGGRRACRSVLLRAGTTVSTRTVDTTSAIVAICFLDPVGRGYGSLEKMMTGDYHGTPVDHRDEAQLVRILAGVRDNRLSASRVQALLEEIVFPPETDHSALPECDPRIVRVVERIKATVRENIPVGELAREVYLSESRLVKLFKSEMNIPITKYRLRYRLLMGVVYLSLNYTVTEAAMAAGFASTAHFSKCYAAMLGTRPSATFLSPPYLEVTLSEKWQIDEGGVLPALSGKKLADSAGPLA